MLHFTGSFISRQGRRMLLLILLWPGMRAAAQQPASFLMGEDPFRGVQIYDVIQDKSLNYWFATNEGIYCFNGVTYEQIICHDSKSSSAFNFVIDKKSGTIYCHNLNNQVFRIKNKKCDLFYELKDKEGSADISLAIDPNGNLLIASRQIIVLSNSGKVLERKQISKHYIGPPFTTDAGNIIYHLNNSDTMLTYTKGHFEFKQLTLNGKRFLKDCVLKSFQSNNRQFSLDLKTKEWYRFDPVNFRLEQLPKENSIVRIGGTRIYETSHGFWIAGSLPGICFFGQKTSTPDGLFFSSYFISDVFEDAEGNVLLSTFDKGILVIPDMNIPDVINRFENDPVTVLYSDDSGGLIMGTSQGKLLCYTDNGLSVLRSAGTRPVECVTGFSNQSMYVFDDGYIRLYNRLTGTTTDVHDASLKDAAFVSETHFYLGTNRGIVEVNLRNNAVKTRHLAKFSSRVHLMEYDPQHQLLYVSTALGLITIDKSHNSKPLLYRQKELFPNGIHVHNGLAYISSKEKGILVFKNGKFVRKIIPLINNRPVAVKRVIVYHNTLLANTYAGFFQFDLNGKLLRSISSAYGFPSNRVVDFILHRGKLWVSHSGGVQQIDPEYRSQGKVVQGLRIDKILVNNREVAIIGKHPVFSSDQRKFQFFFSSSTLRNRETMEFHYRLLGVDEHWNTADYHTRQVTYNALAPGTYTFQIRIKNQGHFSTSRSLTFTVAAPVYFRWWFITLAALLLTGAILFSYRWQLAIQQRKAERINELNASKLTAIQSQMNPHFIFNSLNSIQDLILKGDVEHSYSYITTFSNLVRRTLNYSEKDFIDFDQELKLLELYLSLEKLRFKKDFDYSICTDEVKDDPMIPPLLIQPFVENALVHGLLHREGEKRLLIRFRMEDVLLCIIEDNGIGREAAVKIRQRQRSDHESFSGKAIRRRFEILSNAFGGAFGYEYEDLAENGIATGTRVTLRIPVKKQF